ncbi:hypothetical protein BGZ99_003328 [Dissophora globulifera]|uniref:SIT4 phosphatase-associated protein n=1 Tax=Dissophora globulifera TaxID=979702 RepID=A0A9P6RLQ1_9FUNG|nr:hypothetical protein BGZ99_003328 [Dissophora globulifera]
MYWRFGHQNISVVDHLLESGNVALEELLEQDDLIQECKAQNPKLIEYLRDPAVLQQLLGYIISDDLEDRARFKYPFIACEVIACEVWAIFESALSNIDMLVTFWEFLDRPPPLNPVQASYFTKVIGVFLMKKTQEMLRFIKSQPEVVPKLLLHMSTSSIMDLLLKIISMEESPEGKGTVQVHSVASQVLLDIIAISQSSHPEQPSIGTNVLIDELKSEAIVAKLVGFMLDRTAPHSTSTLINGVTIFIELIRRNNSDYDVEPLPPNTEPVREAVDLSDLLKVLASRIEDFKDLLVVPRSVTGPIETSIGKQVPLGFERLKICEMFAELLHCSNMAVLNSRPIISVSSDGIVKVPTVSANHPFIHHSQTVKEELEAVKTEVTGGSPSLQDGDEEMKEPADDAKQKSKDDIESESKDDTKTETRMETVADTKVEEKTEESVAESKDADEQLEQATASLGLDDMTTPRASPPPGQHSTNDSTPVATPLIINTGEVMIPVGDFLKMQFVDHHIIPTCFDLFFQFPWNNFLHTVVYDMVHQVFHRPMGDIGRPDMDGTYIPPRGDQGVTEGWNRRLTVSIFKNGQLTKRITDAQRLCDYECAQPKGVRLGYMGHLTYIADETVKLLELYLHTSLLPMLYEFIDLEEWWNYVSKVLKETKERDAQVLGGSRPSMMEQHKSMDDGHDDDFMDDHGDEYGSLEGDVASDQFARYLSQQISNNLPEKFGSSDEDEDEEESNWIGEYGSDTDFERRRAAAASGLDDPFGNRHTMDFDDSDDDEGIDEESWGTPWPNTFGETKASDLGSATQFSATLTDWSEDFQDGFTEFKTASNDEDGKEDFDFPPFSVEATAAAAMANKTIGENKNAAATTTDLDTPGDADPFGDSFAEPSSRDVMTTMETESSSPKSGGESLTATRNVEMEPIALGPEVQDTPVLEKTTESDNSSINATPAASMETSPPLSTAASSADDGVKSAALPEASAGKAVELEAVLLADPEAPKLEPTEAVAPASSAVKAETAEAAASAATTVSSSKMESGSSSGVTL